MGGLTVVPELSLPMLDIEQIDMLILPGGRAWEQGGNDEIKEVVKKIIKNNRHIAAICAATTYLGEKGILDETEHTSNDLYYMKSISPNYKGEELYRNELAISDKKIITAKGIAPIEFAREIFIALELFGNDKIEKWYNLFKNGIWSE